MPLPMQLTPTTEGSDRLQLLVVTHLLSLAEKVCEQISLCGVRSASSEQLAFQYLDWYKLPSAMTGLEVVAYAILVGQLK